MSLKKSMISVAVATLLVGGFTGCDTATTNTSSNSASNSATHISNPKGTVSGLVTDSNGNPLEGVKAYLAGQTATTDAGGHYVFHDVPVSNTVGADAPNPNAVLTVTIAAPKGYLGATVTVTPASQIDSAENSGAGSTTSGSETFVDGYIAEATAVPLPELNVTVKARLEDENSGAAVANQEVTLDFMSGPSPLVQYASQTYKAVTDENGWFTLAGVPANSTLNYVVPNYALSTVKVNSNVVTNNETSLVNDGTVYVNPVVSRDTVAPVVTSTDGEIGNSATRVMLEDDIRKTIVIHFSEPMNIEIDKDMTDSVIVKAGKTLATMTKVGATATASGDTLTVTLDNELADGEFLDVNLLITDFKDASGNFIENATTQKPAIGYDIAVGSQILRLQYQAYKNINVDANPVTAFTQQTLDTNGAVDDAALLQAKNSAFNDVVDSGTPTNDIEQMNATDSTLRLAALGNAALSGPVPPLTVTSDVPRLTFTPSGASQYVIKLTRTGTDVGLPLANVIVQDIATLGTIASGFNNNGTANVILTPNDLSSVEPVEFYIASGIVKIGDTVTITPLDDLGSQGTPVVVKVTDNVVPTTVLQKSYAQGNSTDAGSTVVKYGDGGELSNTSGSVSVGTPYLAISAGLLDDLKADGKPVDGKSASDNALTEELYAHNTVNSTTGSAYIPKTSGLYDTSAWNAFTKSLTRTVGIAFSEDVNLSDVTPATENISATLNNWKVNNNVTVNDNGVAVVADLVDVKVDDVMKLANSDNGGVIDFTGIRDAAGNVADAKANAKVVIQDKMPPMATTAKYDGENVTITFNEPVKLTSKDTFTIKGTGAPSTATYTAATASKYVLSADKKTLTIDAAEFAPTLTTSVFDLGTYVEAAYGTDKHGHAALVYNDISDLHGNNWTTTSAGVAAPKFAVAEMIGNFKITDTDNSNFNYSDDTTKIQQIVVWKLSHPIRTTVAGDILNGVPANSAGNYVWDGSVAADMTNIKAWFESLVGTTVTALTQVAGQDTALILDSSKKVLTLKFTTASDITAASDKVRMVAGKVLTSALDSTKTQTVSATPVK